MPDTTNVARKSNWTDGELLSLEEALLEAAQSVIEVINGKLSLFLIHEKKRKRLELVSDRYISVKRW
jgi:hypothetical protein